MEEITFRDVSFCYPGCESKALDGISLAIEAAQFVVICGKSGCGKSTLLRQMKKNASLPIFHSMAQLERTFPEYAAVEKRATWLFNLCCPKISDVTEYPKIVPWQETISQ